MIAQITYRRDSASVAQISEHLSLCDVDFYPRLSERVQIEDYAARVYNRAVRFEAWNGLNLVGLVAAYCNTPPVAFITNVSVLRGWQSKGVAHHLLTECLAHARREEFFSMRLDVNASNKRARGVYREIGFVTLNEDRKIATMQLLL